MGIPDSLNVPVLQRPMGWPRQATAQAIFQLIGTEIGLPDFPQDFSILHPMAQQNNLYKCNILVHTSMTTLPRLPTFFSVPFHHLGLSEFAGEIEST